MKSLRYALALLLFSCPLYAENYSCSLIKDRMSCDLMPKCFYEMNYETQFFRCKGTMRALPRFLSEFQNDTHNVFPIETVLRARDLIGIAFYRKSLAKFINEHKVKDAWVLNNPSIGKDADTQEKAKKAIERLSSHFKDSVQAPQAKKGTPSTSLGIWFINMWKSLLNPALRTSQYPEGVKQIVDLWKEDDGTVEISKSALDKISQITKDPKKLADFLQDWKIYKPFLDFERYLFPYSEWHTQVDSLSKAVVLGNLELLKTLPFHSEMASLFKNDPANILARKLEYNDLDQFLSQFSKTLVVTSGETQYKCPVKGNEYFEKSRQNSWYKKCHPYDSDSSFVYKKSVGELIEAQSSFWKSTEFQRRMDLKNAFVVYQGSGFNETTKFIVAHKNDPFPFEDGDRVYFSGTYTHVQWGQVTNQLNVGILLAPKPKLDLIVYRGQECDKRWVRTPNHFWSTSVDIDIALQFGSGGCLLEIQVPKGFPIFFLQIGSQRLGENNEKEFLIPSHALNKDGKLVSVSFEITKDDEAREFIKTSYNPVQDLEYAIHFKTHAYVVKPASDLMTFEGNEKDFDAYQKRYAKLVCAPENIQDHKDLKEMCDAARG